MADTKELLRRASQAFAPPVDVMDALVRRRERKTRNRRIGTALLALIVALVSFGVLVRAFESARTPRPAADLFEGIHGWITFGDEAGIWAVDPANPDDPADRVRLSAVGGEPVDWSSDGSKLLIRRKTDTGSASPYGLFVLTADGTETHLVPGRYLSGGSFSPDGSEVVYAADTQGPGAMGIFIIDVDGGTPRRLLHGSEIGVGSGDPLLYLPTFSPDGTRIAHVTGGSVDRYALWMMNADGTGRTRLLSLPFEFGWITHLVWSPDGTRLAFDFASQHDGEPGVTEHLALDLANVVIPGKRGEEPRSDIYVVDADGSGLGQVIRGASNPQWSPDGSRIAYSTGVSVQVPFTGSLGIAMTAGSTVQRFGCCASGPWNPLTSAEADRV